MRRCSNCEAPVEPWERGLCQPALPSHLVTVIAACADADGVYMACDSEEHDSESGLRYPAPPKVWHHPAGLDSTVLLAMAGDSCVTKRVKLQLNIEAIPDDADPLDCDRWADAIAGSIWQLATGSDQDQADLTDDDRATPDYEALLAFDGKVWYLAPTGDALLTQRTYEAIGSGKGTAFGVLYAAAAIAADPRTAVRLAAEAAIEHVIGCGGQVHTYSLAKSGG